MKMLGIFLIVFSCSILGFNFRKYFLCYLEDIIRAEKFISNIIIGIKSEKISLKEIFKNNLFNNDKKMLEFTKRLKPSELYKGKEIAMECGFCKNKQALSILSECFSIIGKYSAEEQISELEILRNKLLLLYKNSESEYKSKAKISGFFGILGGIFIALVLL